MAVEEIAGNAMDWKGFEHYALVSTDAVTSGAFTSKVTTGGTPIFQTAAADSADPYKIGATGFGFRTAYSGTGALNVIKSGIYLPGNWQKLFLSCRIRVVVSAIADTKKFELMAVRNAAGGTLFGLQWERVGAGLHFRHFLGHPASSGHPAGATAYLADTNITARATNTYFTVLLVAEAVYLPTPKTNLTIYVDGTAGATISDAAFANAPWDPRVFIPGGSQQIILGAYGMDNAVNTQNVNYDVLRYGFTPPLVGAAGVGMSGVGAGDPGLFLGAFA